MPPDAECSYADCHVIPIVMPSVINAECQYAECHYGECHYGECWGAPEDIFDRT